MVTAIVRLRLTASAMYPTSSVSCRVNGAPLRRVTFWTIRLPGKPSRSSMCLYDFQKSLLVDRDTTTIAPQSDNDTGTTDKSYTVDRDEITAPQF